MNSILRSQELNEDGFTESSLVVTGRPASSKGVRVFFTALSSLTLVLYFFSPDYVLWRTLPLSTTVAGRIPEVSRAKETLKQVENPWQPIENRTHMVIRWRMFFPLLMHYLRLPDSLFLSLPWLGCLITTFYISLLMFRRSDDLLVTGCRNRSRAGEAAKHGVFRVIQHHN